ncbi:lytic transglycosylase domain-containing protein [Altericroceibacterium endophyticum]|uniref:Transglycosylase SLT domain-containing protein n=1 Tax=Altericroceibacterium endophyticum TaxID=1808508 RepID=A0A6I4T080_9SPHN|nr:lytic transglycosylase domain-containing protein [Altericroceibacterium endophyticum]MXO64357.1 transglycosylase SLT domain-containing protein [Altericroceibacterium endophyticum]
MSSMVRTSILPLLLATTFSASTPAGAQSNFDTRDWDNAREALVAREPGRMAAAVQQWERLKKNKSLDFSTYANFLATNPGFPDEMSLRVTAESRLQDEYVPADRLIAFFDRFPPQTNEGRAHYALALSAVRPQEAMNIAREAWRNGGMNETAEATILAMYGANFSRADQDARMDALLWQRDPDAAARQMAYVSPDKRALFQARLAILQGGDGATNVASALSDPGYLYNRSRELRLEGRPTAAVSMLANRPLLSSLPYDQTLWVEELLNVAKIADARSAQKIAASVDDAFRGEADISTKPYKLRDDYTSLMWLGGTESLWKLGDAAKAAPLFYRYGAAAQTPQTRSKGFYWAGLASAKAQDRASAKRYYEMAAQYPDRFYGLLALKELGRDVPDFADGQAATPTAQERAAFHAQPLTAAVAEVARDAPWSTGIRFYREIAGQAETPAQHQLVAELAQNIGRRDLAVNVGEAAGADGVPGFTRFAFPTLDVPPGADWTMVHAITRQESQFAQNAISWAGARGLMQLMPGTAREQAGKTGIQYMSASLIDDSQYNIRLGNGYFQRMLAYYDGYYPLAVAAYNAGPGNVNKWLRANGDPRRGAVEWTKWIEEIPIFETKNYVQRVLENAVVYERLYPEKATYGRPRDLSDFLR